jgi:hypothetical protein
MSWLLVLVSHSHYAKRDDKQALKKSKEFKSMQMARLVLKLNPSQGGSKEMLYPTMTAMVLGVLFVTALAAVDWYVWSIAAVSNWRRPVSARPLTVRELANKLLGRVVAINAEVLPHVATTIAEVKPAVSGNDEGHGFKRVA